ncbi:MAG: S8 family serine peptidase, partial [bacterium]
AGEIPNENVIGFHGAIPADLDAWVQQRGGELLMRDDVLHWVSARFADGAAADRVLQGATARPDVAYAHRDGIATIQMVPNDPMYPQQWGFPAIFAEQAWDLGRGSHAVKVAILDTGIQITHPDLAANACGPFTSFNPGEPTINDLHGHGTHVSGTVAAVTNNNLGVAGMSDSCLMGAKVLGAFGGGQWTWVASGIRWAADNGAHIISMSLGGGNPGAVMESAVQYAYDTKGVLIVAAAGNSQCNLGGVGGLLPQPGNDGTIIWPARYDEVMAVAALRPPGDGTATFSSCGADLEIAAPGEGVLSTWRGSSYATISGTSMATPHVSGVAALLKAQNPSMSAFELRCMLDLSSDEGLDSSRTPFPGRDPNMGWGRTSPLKGLLADQQLAALGGYGTFHDVCEAGGPHIME